MSKAFLNQILRIEKSVQSGEGHSCYICFQEYGTLCPESGVIEVAVRLPCQHAMGSACIAKWLHSNNTCPICREIFFPLEHEDTDDEDLIPSETEFGEEGGEDLQVSARRDDRKSISSDLIEIWRFTEDLAAAAAACIYIATHLMGEPRTFEEIARVAPAESVSAYSAYVTYSHLYDNRRELIEDSWAGDLGIENLQNALALLPDVSTAAMEHRVQETLEAIRGPVGISRADV